MSIVEHPPAEPFDGRRAAPPVIETITDLLLALQTTPGFAWTKINHGFWEALGEVEHLTGWPADDEQRREADRIARRAWFFEGGFVEELIDLLLQAGTRADPDLHLAFELSAWPGDERIIGTPFRPEFSQPLMDEYAARCGARGDGLLLKKAIQDDLFMPFIEEARQHSVVLVGPGYLESFLSFAQIPKGVHLAIHPHEARRNRAEIEARIASALDDTGGDGLVLLQAGTLAPYWIMRLRERFPRARWVDGGLAFSICHLPDILERPWGRVYREQIVRCHEGIAGPSPHARKPRFDAVARHLADEADVAPPDQPVRFIEAKSPDASRVAHLLQECDRSNRWANEGPLYRVLARSYHDYMNLGQDVAVVPCANGGMAVEALARLCDHDVGKRRRWVTSAFAFMNLGRGYFSDAKVLDCDASGMLSLDALRGLSRRSFDGIVVTNIFGLWADYSPYIEFARAHGKALIIDNAAGVARQVPDWPYKAFSLHHTKPFGVGEGGMMIAPAAQADAVKSLLSYGELTSGARGHWVNNGKLSEISCAYLLDRLERSAQWAPLYEMQALRIAAVASRAGLVPLFSFAAPTIATSMPFLAPRPVPAARLANDSITFGKYYRPLADLPQARGIFERLVNVPSHPDVASVATDDLLAAMQRLCVGMQARA